MWTIATKFIDNVQCYFLLRRFVRLLTITSAFFRPCSLFIIDISLANTVYCTFQYITNLLRYTTAK